MYGPVPNSVLEGGAWFLFIIMKKYLQFVFIEKF